MKSTIISVLIGGTLIGGTLLISRGQSNTVHVVPVQNVSMVNGTQIVGISAKGGYSPQISKAKSDTPTVIRMTTNATFDCSSIVKIPSLAYEKNLPPSGVTDIEIPPQKAGTKLEGLCVMGMYNFEVQFD